MRLAFDRIHGPVVHMLREEGQFYAATALGQHLHWDLSVFDRDYCALLREVWRDTPFAWKDGRAVVSPPPEGHRCRTEP